MWMVMDGNAIRTSDQIQDRAYWANNRPQESDDPWSPRYRTHYLSDVPVLERPEDNMVHLNQQSPSFIRFSTEQICGFLTTTLTDRAGDLSDLSSLPDGYLNLRLLTEDQYVWPAISWPAIMDHNDNMIGYLCIRPGLLEDHYIPKSGRRVGLDLICIGGLELEYNEFIQRKVAGVGYLHRECPRYPGGIGPECAIDRSLCKLGPNWKYRFYNVLWVEWKDNIAYRKGIGKIWADCWEKLERVEIEVTLG